MQRWAVNESVAKSQQQRRVARRGAIAKTKITIRYDVIILDKPLGGGKPLFGCRCNNTQKPHGDLEKKYLRFRDIIDLYGRSATNRGAALSQTGERGGGAAFHTSAALGRPLAADREVVTF